MSSDTNDTDSSSGSSALLDLNELSSDSDSDTSSDDEGLSSDISSPNISTRSQSSPYVDAYCYDYDIKSFAANLQRKTKFSKTFKHAKCSAVYRLQVIFKTTQVTKTKWVSIQVSWNPVKFSPGSSSPAVLTRFQVSLLDNNNQLLKQTGSVKTPCFSQSSKNARLFRKFVKVEELTTLDAKNQLTLRVHCRMWDLASGKSLNDVKRSSEIQFHARKKICSDFRTLLHESSFHDVEIKTPTKRFKVHRAVLSARSSVFSAMLSTNMSEANSGIINIDDFDDTVIEKMLKYIYCGEVNNFEENILELLKIADKYNIQDMKKKCVQIVPSIVNIKDAVDILVVTDQLNLHKLKLEIVKYINSNKSEVVKTESFKSLRKVYPWLLEELYVSL